MRRSLILALLVVSGACAPPGARQKAHARRVPDAGPAVVVEDPAPPSALAHAYYVAYLAESLGKLDEARAGYEALVIAEHGRDDALVVARAALRLARLEALDGKRRRAVDLLGQASILGGDDPEVTGGVDRLRLQLDTQRGEELGVPGPAVNTQLEGVSAEAAARFRKAEAMLPAYSKLSVRRIAGPFDDDLTSKRSTLEAVVRAYRAVVELAEPVATAAAQFRIGRLYHDAALFMLILQPPDEYNSDYRRDERDKDRRLAAHYFKNARVAYEASRDAARGVAGAELWQAAARDGLRSTPP